MPTLDWLKKGFAYGYTSGNVLTRFPGLRRLHEERRAGGSYRRVFFQAIVPYIQRDSVVLELGPGRGSWSRAILEYIPDGVLHVVDFQDAAQWLKPEGYRGRLVCHHVNDNSFSCVPNDTFDFFWSFGVLCHNNARDIEEILRNALPRMKKGGIAVHHHGDWDKLEAFGWKKGNVPLEFKSQPDDQIWWPRNNTRTMASLAERAGWTVVAPDLGLLKRDSIIVLQRKAL
ncbi:MAG: class I SAM-dependent methyltransferase [Verrucomicrobia bacterium]|nr:class I SAM-dependent methyltransferase [Verrucomicrobiota bacterium]